MKNTAKKQKQAIKEHLKTAEQAKAMLSTGHTIVIFPFYSEGVGVSLHPKKKK